MADKANEQAIELTDPEDTRRIEDVLRRHGVDPARAIEQRDWQEQGNAVRRLLAIAQDVLPADEYQRVLADLGRS